MEKKIILVYTKKETKLEFSYIGIFAQDIYVGTLILNYNIGRCFRKVKQCFRIIFLFIKYILSTNRKKRKYFKIISIEEQFFFYILRFFLSGSMSRSHNY